ncbi:MAG: hypothetical protein E7214_07215 [Clostridium sp.]|nr:hypothetical protein [Clostridium sp.]
MEKLEELEITDESIKDISKLPELQSIKKLSLSNNNISDITPLNKFDFKNLQLNNNKIYDCSGLELYYHNDFGYFELQDRLDIQYQDVKLPDIT